MPSFVAERNCIQNLEFWCSIGKHYYFYASTQQKITDVKRLTNISDVSLLSDVADDKCTCALLVHYKRLMNILDVSLLSVCTQAVDRYIVTKRKRKFNEIQENNTIGECKQLSQEKKSNIGPIHWTANGCPMF